MILLDTNVVSAVMQNHPDPAVVSWLDLRLPDEIWLPSVVVFELRYGLGLLPAESRGRGLEQGLGVFLSELMQGFIAPLACGRFGYPRNGPAGCSAQIGQPARHPGWRNRSVHQTKIATRNWRLFQNLGLPMIKPFHV